MTDEKPSGTQEGPHCRLCGKYLKDVGGYLERVNAKGVPGIWECRPTCDADLPQETNVMLAIEGDKPQRSNDDCVICPQCGTEFVAVPVNVQAELAAEKAAREKAEHGVYVPGVMRCAKCKLEIITTILDASSGNMYANNAPQQCPNGCGPLWRITEREQRKEAQELFDKEFDLREKAEAEAARPREELAAAKTDNESEILRIHNDKMKHFEARIAAESDRDALALALAEFQEKAAGVCEKQMGYSEYRQLTRNCDARDIRALPAPSLARGRELLAELDKLRKEHEG